MSYDYKSDSLKLRYVLGKIEELRVELEALGKTNEDSVRAGVRVKGRKYFAVAAKEIAKLQKEIYSILPSVVWTEPEEGAKL